MANLDCGVIVVRHEGVARELNLLIKERQTLPFLKGLEGESPSTESFLKEAFKNGWIKSKHTVSQEDFVTISYLAYSALLMWVIYFSGDMLPLLAQFHGRVFSATLVYGQNTFYFSYPVDALQHRLKNDGESQGYSLRKIGKLFSSAIFFLVLDWVKKRPGCPAFGSSILENKVLFGKSLAYYEPSPQALLYLSPIFTRNPYVGQFHKGISAILIADKNLKDLQVSLYRKAEKRLNALNLETTDDVTARLAELVAQQETQDQALRDAYASIHALQQENARLSNSEAA
jgi:hypothetical protein